ncbi:ADP-ribosylation factor-like protein 9 isoform X12 [Denticeps clupeoides]|uniref:ADP-ribosylation factor-like protein 9 isoform X12 n=1 Tax=Denticeps clupeoides TaxID=299321 RepID=UPI0010A2FC33|nr:ADP-ribosylation factor-like protein 9 isoform X12 [Denticeps clupeoides]XP_028815311.1 ADP-ribosylation factor-like protein 9 isoform X12 [Denticeps clupeoides]
MSSVSGARRAGLWGLVLAAAGGVALAVWSVVWRRRRRGVEPGDRSAASEVKSSGQQVLLLGLEGSGKSSLLQCFTAGGLEYDVSPTQGFSAVSVHREEVHVEFLEIGGAEHLRLYWDMYLSRAAVLVYVVDSSDRARLPLARRLLHRLLRPEPRLPLVVLANKQDLPGACSVTDLHEALSLSDLGDQRKMFLIGTHLKKTGAQLDAGLQDARDLILQMVAAVREDQERGHETKACSFL